MIRFGQIGSDHSLVFRVYSFNQGDDFAIWSKGGVCDAISIDWIRRYLISKKKRFDDPKYEAGFFYNSPGRQKLGTKHILLSHLYRDAKEEARSNLPKGSTQWSGEAFHKLAKGYHSNEARASRKAAKQATANESGLERLQAKLELHLRGKFRGAEGWICDLISSKI